ncbi:MAG: sugar transferase [Treponemataceae bacterium]|nr:sugar transferase [Treponemataceae bacterium]
MKFSRKRRQFFIFFIDLLIMILSVYISLAIRNLYLPTFLSFLVHLLNYPLVILTWVVIMYTLGMYSLEIPFRTDKTLIKLLVSATAGTLVGFATFYLFSSDDGILPKTVLVVYNLTSLFLIYFWRYIFDKHFSNNKNLNKYVFIGYNETVESLLELTSKNSYVNFSPTAVFDEFISIRPSNLPESVTFLHTYDELKIFLANNTIKVYVMPSEKIFSSEVRRLLFDALSNRAVFYSLPDFFEVMTRRIPLGAINESWFLRHIHFESRGLYYILKRFFDVIISGTLLLITIVFWPLFAIIIKVESKGPVFFRQIREGKSGKRFTLYKFRTMRSEDNNFSPTTEKDNRITKFGNIMRKTRIDELPQLLNVIKGDMSLIGPRPERPELSAELETTVPFFKQRLMVKPGITGWDQVSGEYHSPSKEDTYKKLQYDLYYIKNQSPMLDISIFFKTIMTIFLRQGR